VTDAVVDEVATWQSRPLDRVWPVVFLDALVIKVREQGVVQNKSAYLALGIGADGRKEILGLWLEATEGAKFWLKVISELKNRGVEDIFIACCDGLKGFPQAIEAVFPRTIVPVRRWKPRNREDLESELPVHVRSRDRLFPALLALSPFVQGREVLAVFERVRYRLLQLGRKRLTALDLVRENAESLGGGGGRAVSHEAIVCAAGTARKP
jgi:hypothetical protein